MLTLNMRFWLHLAKNKFLFIDSTERERVKTKEIILFKLVPSHALAIINYFNQTQSV